MTQRTEKYTNADTFGTWKSVLIREVSWFQGWNNTYFYCMHWDETKCPDYTRCPDFRMSTFRGSTIVLVHREVGTGNPRSSRTAIKSSLKEDIPPVPTLWFPINLASKFLQLHFAHNTALEGLFDLSRDHLIRASIQSVQCGVYGLLFIMDIFPFRTEVGARPGNRELSKSEVRTVMSSTHSLNRCKNHIALLDCLYSYHLCTVIFLPVCTFCGVLT